MLNYNLASLSDSGIVGWFHTKPALCLLSGQTLRSFVWVKFDLSSLTRLHCSV